MREFIDRFLKMEAASGILLILAAGTALLMVNSPLQNLYLHLFDAEIQVRIASLDINKPLILWINDGLMAIFFLVIGLEVKRELIEGALSSLEKAVLPIIAALGGMLVPATIYLIFNGGDESLRNGWAIPAATDIAFALGIMALLGKRVPASLKIFLLALAIADDLGVVLVIALFYTNELAMQPLVWAAAALLILIFMNRHGIGDLTMYVLVGIVLWIAVLKSGVHATLAGVALGFTIPLKDARGESPLKKIEHSLHSVTGFIILPLFAFANAGVSLKGIGLSTFQSNLSLGVILGLLVGKPVGIFLCSLLAIRFGLAHLPEKTTMAQLFATSILAGIGFTMSIFISSLAFSERPDYVEQARLAILSGSALAAIFGYFILRISTPSTK